MRLFQSSDDLAAAVKQHPDYSTWLEMPQASSRIDFVQPLPSGVKVLTRAIVERQDREQPARVADRFTIAAFDS